MKAKIGQKAPSLTVSEWVQGNPVNLDQLTGRVVLVEVFQVNCPGCFLYALPQAVGWHNRYADRGLAVLGVATAFEDFDKNTLENLTLLAETGVVIGETQKLLSLQGQLREGRLPYRIPFPLAMDRLNRRQQAVGDDEIVEFIREHAPDVEQRPVEIQQQIYRQVRQYLQSLTYRAATFECFGLKGTPSHILIDKQGILVDCGFGVDPDLENKIIQLLKD